MKNLNDKQIENQINEATTADFQPSFQMSVYNEMLDQTAQNIDVLKMIQDQFAELNQSATKRNLLLKEISQYLK